MLRLRKDIPLFPGGRKKAFTLSTDDGVTQDGRLASLMRKYGIKGTFNLNSGLMGHNDWLVQPGINVSHYKYPREEITRIYDGFEIAVHTVSHPDLTSVPSSMISYEISADKKALEALVRRPVRGMAYPFGTYNDEVAEIAAQCGIIYSRTVKETFSFKLPRNFLIWHPTCHYCDKKQRISLGEQFLAPVPDAEYKEPLLFYVWGHAYQLDAYEDWDSIEDFFKLISHRDDIWYASNLEICSYLKAVDHLIYSSSGDYITNPSCQDVWLQIDHKPYHIPAGATITVYWEHQ